MTPGQKLEAQLDTIEAQPSVFGRELALTTDDSNLDPFCDASAEPHEI